MNDYKICDICKGFNTQNLIDEIKAIDENSKITVKCLGLCAVGDSKPFVILNGILITGETIDEVIVKIKKMINKK